MLLVGFKSLEDCMLNSFFSISLCQFVCLGDHVIPLYVPQCGDCNFCQNPKTNLCQKIRFEFYINDYYNT